MQTIIIIGIIKQLFQDKVIDVLQYETMLQYVNNKWNQEVADNQSLC